MSRNRAAPAGGFAVQEGHFSAGVIRKIRDPRLTKNPRPNLAKSATRV